MLILTKAVGLLLLPPGILIVSMVVGLFFYRHRLGKGLLYLSILFLWFLSIEPVKDALIQPLEARFSPIGLQIPASVDGREDLVVLLGGGVYAQAPEYGGVLDHLHSQALLRTIYAADLALKNHLNVIATGGSPLDSTQEPEGLVMRRWLMRLGLDGAHVQAETSSNTTWDNACNTKQLLLNKGVDLQSVRVVIVTSATHMVRAVWSFEQQGLQVLAAPCDYLVEKNIYTPLSYLPDADVLADVSRALHERIGQWWYQWRYGA
ncbi:MAG: YdcF family protein [Zetaproteobacteria bacterium]|nr:YdcF family protein [Zetaproteobacteria bacterium]